MMTKTSPAVTRTVSVLNFFADHPGQAFTLTDIVRALRLSRATCHALLAALVEANYLYRTSDKNYVLGSALARIAMVAQKHLLPLQVAGTEMRMLADELDLICSAVFQDKDMAVVRERAASVSHIGWSTPEGLRMPLRPPFGNVFMAWSRTAEIERWISRVIPAPDRQERENILEALAFPKRHGFAIGTRTEHLRDEAHARSLIYRSDKTNYLVSDLDLEAGYDLAFVSAPVFDADGGVLFVLSLMGFTRATSGTETMQIGKRLRQSCDRISGFLGGAVPTAG
jgi:DNA-binding IclR family transcriptional regulator